MYIKDVFSVIALSGGITIASIGIFGMRVISGAAVLGRWPVGWREWGRFALVVGFAKVRRFQIYAVLWFFGSGFLSLGFTATVMIYGKRKYGWP